jgi:16S rRNA (guanine527-N7)-methyltransferase
MRPEVDVVPGDAARRAQVLSAAQVLGVALDDAVLDRLMAYLQLLQRWNQVYNLTALRDPALMLSHHLVDCLAVVPALRRWAESDDASTATGDGVGAVDAAPLRSVPSVRRLSILDVGSGGGLPGVVLAAVQPAWQVACVDTVAKKASFIRQVAAELRMPNLQGHHARVENLQPPPAFMRAEGAADRAAAPGYDLITSRAFASLPDFTRLSAHLLAPGGVWMAMKGKPPDDEQAVLPPGVEVFHVEHLQVPGLDAQRCLVWMRRKTA